MGPTPHRYFLKYGNWEEFLLRPAPTDRPIFSFRSRFSFRFIVICDFLSDLNGYSTHFFPISETITYLYSKNNEEIGNK